MKITAILTFVLSIMLLSTSCGEFFLESSEDEDLINIKLISMGNGSVIKKGEQLQFRIIKSEDGQEPEKLEINLINQMNESIGIYDELDLSDLKDELISINFSESLKTGQYTLEFILYSEENIIIKEKEIFFFYTEEDYNISGIESFPPLVFLGATALLTGVFDTPDESNPFIRWSINDKVIAKGPFIEGIDKILWSVPEEEGVYTVRVELFPTIPFETDDFNFQSEIFMDVELYVSKAEKPPGRYLYPEESYYFLLHFNGNLLNSGEGLSSINEQNEAIEAEIVGNPELITTEEDFGYYFDGTSGFKVPVFILPVIEGVLNPFTLSIGLEIEVDQKEKNILTCTTFDNIFSFSIYINSDFLIFARIRSGNKEILIPSEINISTLKNRRLISISILPEGDKFLAMWFLDGIQTNTLFFENMNMALSPLGETIIGGENGFSGTIDEVGTFYMDALGRYTINPDLYKHAMQQKYDDNIIIAEGFDGIYVPEIVKVEGENNIDNGKLILETSLKIELPDFKFIDDEVIVIVDFAPPVPDGGNISFFWKDESEPVINIDTIGTVSTSDLYANTIIKNIKNSLYMRIQEQGTLMILNNNEDNPMKIRIREPKGDSNSIVMKIINNSEASIPIDAITVVKKKE